MNNFDKIAGIDLSQIDNKKLVAEAEDAIGKYLDAKEKGYEDIFHETYGEVGQVLIEKLEKSLKPLRKKDGKLPSKSEATAFYKEIAPTFNLHLPFHESISEGEKIGIAQEMARLLCDKHSCYSEREKAIDWAVDYLEGANSRALERLKKQGRKAFDEQETAGIKEKCDSLEMKAKKTPSEPRPKKQFGTSVIDNASRSLKKALQKRVKEEGGKKDADFSKIEKDIQEVKSAGEKFLKSLYKVAGQKTSSDVVDRFQKMVDDLIADFKPSDSKE